MSKKSMKFLSYHIKALQEHCTRNQHNNNTCYGGEHWKTAKRVLRYRKRTQDMGIQFAAANKYIADSTDADWSANIDDRKSCIDFAFKSWESTKQNTILFLSTEAE